MSDESYIYLCTSFVLSSDFVQSFLLRSITIWQSIFPTSQNLSGRSLFQIRQLLFQVSPYAHVPEILTCKQQFVQCILTQQCMHQSWKGIYPFARPDMFQLQLIRRHLFRYVHCISVVLAPVFVEQPVLMTLIDRRARHKVHTLDQRPLDMVPDHKISQLIPRRPCGYPPPK